MPPPNLAPSSEAVAPAGSSSQGDQGAGQVMAELHAAAQTADVAPGDPLAAPVAASAIFIGFADTRTAALGRNACATAAAIEQALQHARASALRERNRLQVHADAVNASVIDTVARTVAKTAEDAIERHLTVLSQNRAFLAAFLVVGIVGTSLAGGYEWGRTDALAQVHHTEDGLREAFTAHPAEAATWANLMRWNHLRGALERCNKPGQSLVHRGRTVCAVPLWIAPPSSTLPAAPVPVALVPAPPLPAVPIPKQPTASSQQPPDDPLAWLRPPHGPVRFGP